MTAFDIYSAVGGLDENILEETEKPLRPKINMIPAAAIAACFLVLIAGFYFTRKEVIPPENEIMIDGELSRPYKDEDVGVLETSIIWQWEYQTICEQYRTITVDGKLFISRAREIVSSLLGDVIGSYEAEGYDIYTEQTYRQTFEVRQIQGVSDDLMVAVNMDGKYYVFMNDKYDPPSTFGELLDGYDLADTLELNKFITFKGYTAEGYYSLDNDDLIWQTLSTCRDAVFIPDDPWFDDDKNYISFTVTSEKLGIYKKGFSISDDGYLWTNIIEWKYIYNIGEEAAGRIISYVMENAEESEPEPYIYSVAGTFTGIIDGYILVDDSILCSDPDDGMVFRIPTDDLRIRRYIDTQTIKVGDIVRIQFTGNIDTAAGNVVNGVYSVSPAIIFDGNAMVEE